MLKFTIENSKLVDGQIIISLPAGYSCPFALTCLAFAHKETGKIQDGEEQLVRCYAASEESAFKNARLARHHNFEQLKRCKTIAQIKSLILSSLPESSHLVRIHSSGDYFSQAYFDAWLLVAMERPNQIFYCYTKAIPFWLKALKEGRIPSNFKLNASFGGKFDNLILPHDLKSATIVYSQEQASFLGLEIDNNDELAWKQDKSFALLIHGNGPQGSLQANLFKKHVMAKIKAKKARLCNT